LSKGYNTEELLRDSESETELHQEVQDSFNRGFQKYLQGEQETMQLQNMSREQKEQLALQVLFNRQQDSR
jgi:hypothetical protein